VLFYLLFVPSTILLVLMYINLHRLTKRDHVLFCFCQIRRNIMETLRNDGSNISKSDYTVIRNLLDTMNTTIHYFDDLKVTMFNFRRFISLVEDCRKNADKIDNMSTSNAKINVLKNKYRGAMLYAFLSYTPLMKPMIKQQITVELFIAVLNLLLRFGFKSFQLEKSIEDLSWLKNQRTAFSNCMPQLT